MFLSSEASYDLYSKSNNTIPLEIKHAQFNLPYNVILG